MPRRDTSTEGGVSPEAAISAGFIKLVLPKG
jgi:hypothetical protein